MRLTAEPKRPTKLPMYIIVTYGAIRGGDSGNLEANVPLGCVHAVMVHFLAAAMATATEVVRASCSAMSIT